MERLISDLQGFFHRIVRDGRPPSEIPWIHADHATATRALAHDTATPFALFVTHEQPDVPIPITGSILLGVYVSEDRPRDLTVLSAGNTWTVRIDSQHFRTPFFGMPLIRGPVCVSSCPALQTVQVVLRPADILRLERTRFRIGCCYFYDGALHTRSWYQTKPAVDATIPVF